ncbi:hypothetical protein COY95_02900, partial [Candidatus Woesearchaeota archaeon CG_4_10_14_0_8_um_filter_47_5]
STSYLINISKRCAKSFTQQETNYSTTTIGSKVWKTCYNDTDGDGIKDYFKVQIPTLRSVKLKAASFVGINILNEKNYPENKAYDKNETIYIRVNETLGTSLISKINVTLKFNDSTKKTYAMTNNVGGNPNLWQYNYLILEPDAQGLVNITALAYDAANTLLVNDTESVRIVPRIKKTAVDSSGILRTYTNLFSSQNTEEFLTFLTGGTKSSISIQIPKSATVSYGRLKLTGQEYSGSYLTYVTLNIAGGETEWSMSGTFDYSAITSDVKNALNQYLSTCSMDGNGYCDVPLQITSNTAGLLSLNSVEVYYYTNESGSIRVESWWRNESNLVY